MYRCESCDIWFCEKHLQPRLVFVRGPDGISPEYKLEFQKEWNREETHPDFQYTKKWLEELDIEEKKRKQLLKEALDRMNHYYPRQQPQNVKPKYVEPRDEIESYEQPKRRRHFPTKKVIGLLLMAVAIGAVIYFSPKIIPTIKNNTSQSSGLTLPLNAWITYNQYSISYHFDVFTAQNELWVAPSGSQGSTETFTVKESATYTAFTLNITIQKYIQIIS